MNKSTLPILFGFLPFFISANQVCSADLDKDIASLQRQIAELQKQINELSSQNETKSKTTPSGALHKDSETMQKEILPGVKIKLGGYVETTGIWRSKNQTQDAATTWNNNANNTSGLPFDNNVNAHQMEFRGSARASRFSVATEGNVDKDLKLSSFVEIDFMGAARTANSIETNSYNPRLRHAFAEATRNDLGLKFVGGQTWSLAVLNSSGIDTMKTLTTKALDYGYVPGVIGVRVPQIRLVKSFDEGKFNLGVSAESPQVSFGQVNVPTSVVSATNPGSSSSFDPNVQFSTDLAPDIVGKIAYDAGLGHYELFGLMRFFHDNLNADFSNRTAIAGGGGAGAYWNLFSKKLEIHTSVVGGKGIGRYTAGKFPDAAFAPNGEIKPLTKYSGVVGAIFHPDPSWDLFAYFGYDTIFRQDEGSASYGYGSYALNNSGCYVNGGSCPAQTSSIWQVSPGFWKQLYKGDYGSLRVGASYSLTRRNAFSDANGNAPHAYQSVVMTALRYYPFK